MTLNAGAFAAEARVGWQFDSGFAPDKARELLVEKAPGRVPPGSWIRLRGMEGWAVEQENAEKLKLRNTEKGGEAGPEENAESLLVNRRREALADLRHAGFRLVAFVRWSQNSWKGGVRGGQTQNRLPKDLRDAFERCRGLAAAYGDLVDFWEIENEPDISFVQENPEVYAAFLKACYLGIAAGRGGSQKAEKLNLRKPEIANQPFGVSREGLFTREMSRVLMAPLALPPGPYFEAFVRNDGLRYTDGFNYHFYGHAEDFSGMYWQFRKAVRELNAETLKSWDAEMDRQEVEIRKSARDLGISEFRRFGISNSALFRTHFYPSAAGWRGEVTAQFNHPAEAAATTAQALLARPHAEEEPELKQHGRWLTTGGVTVEELPDGWRFRVEGWPDGPIRAPAVELPLPPDWKPGDDSILSFEYRTVPQAETKAATSVAPPPGKAETLKLREAEIDYSADHSGAGRIVGGSTPESQPPGDSASQQLEERLLPIFLTEYGYGSLDKISRETVEGRERQGKFFSRVIDQIKGLGIEGAMAFYFPPYLERDRLEFGLLMNEEVGEGENTEKLKRRNAENGKGGAEGNNWRKWGQYTMSPALEQLLGRANETFQPKRWAVRTPAASPIVIDFIARKGLGMAKSYSGYFLEGQAGRASPGEGDLVLYNFGKEPISGEIELEGEAWALATKNTETPKARKTEMLSGGGLPGARALRLTLQPGERRLLPVHVRTTATRFVAQAATARFRAWDPGDERLKKRNTEMEVAAAERVSGQPVAPKPPEPPRVAPMPAAGQPVHTFESYFRTANGNLYQTWPRLVPVETWQTYIQRIENFTPAFYGRLHQPSRFLDNKPVALVFFFHPEVFPAVFEVRRPMMVRYFQPADGQENAEKAKN